jgi:hypothetical protein
MTTKPLTEAERLILADAFASINWVICGRCPDIICENLERLILVLDLPEHRHFEKYRRCWSPTAPRASHRLSRTELDVVAAWIDAVTQVLAGRVTNQVETAVTRLRMSLQNVVVNDCKQMWREVSVDERMCHSI